MSSILNNIRIDLDVFNCSLQNFKRNYVSVNYQWTCNGNYLHFVPHFLIFYFLLNVFLFIPFTLFNCLLLSWCAHCYALQFNNKLFFLDCLPYSVNSVSDATLYYVLLCTYRLSSIRVILWRSRLLYNTNTTGLTLAKLLHETSETRSFNLTNLINFYNFWDVFWVPLIF